MEAVSTETDTHFTPVTVEERTCVDDPAVLEESNRAPELYTEPNTCNTAEFDPVNTEGLINKTLPELDPD